MEDIYKRVCSDIDFNPYANCPIQRKEYFYAYKNGEGKRFDTRKEALGFSKNIEKVFANKHEFDAWKSNFDRLKKLAHDQWLFEVREHYIKDDVTPAIFDACYVQVSYDDVSDYYHTQRHLEDRLNFAVMIKKVVLTELQDHLNDALAVDAWVKGNDSKTITPIDTNSIATDTFVEDRNFINDLVENR